MARDRSRLDGDICAFIVRAQLHEGACPTYREIARYFGMKMYDVVAALHRLQEQGHIRLLPHKARAIEVVSMPEPLADKLLRVFEQIDRIKAGDREDEG